MSRKKLGFVAFVATGVGLILSTILKEIDFFMLLPIAAIAGLFYVGLVEHYKELLK
ncbi:hypothetical protein [Alkaliphilus serpentinus]|uniref:hypothetical protein n=1 Tax=Alkaliphilus serpentinus TaxID=1482731 RepID=UPI0018658445|nr:hypothetical protein [Alkaliphilus serpentinus]